MNKTALKLAAALLLSTANLFAQSSISSQLLEEARKRALILDFERSGGGGIRAFSLDTCPVKQTLSCPAAAIGSLTNSSCIDPVGNSYGDKYLINLGAGQFVRLEMSSTVFTVFPILRSPDGDSRFGETTSFLFDGRSVKEMYVTVPATGTYTLEAEALYEITSANPHMGNYTVKVDCLSCSPAPAPGQTALSLLNNRFQVSLSARDQRSGATGAGSPLPENDLFGYFSIPALTQNPSNAEVFVKILDGRAINGKFWVFYGTMTDLEFTLTVTDTLTNTTRTYQRPGGSACGNFDTAAF